MVSVIETPLRFTAGDSSRIGIVHEAAGDPRRGVLMVVGGPQYRAGSHRLYVAIARNLADAGVPVMRFDHGGVGDSGGSVSEVEGLAREIDAAITAFQVRIPGLDELILWGLCDGATAALLYAAASPTIAGLVLVNPWSGDDSPMAAGQLGHYYGAKMRHLGFWKRLVRGEVDFAGAMRDLANTLRRRPGGPTAQNSLPRRLDQAAAGFDRPILLVLSGQDLTARKFETACNWTAARRLTKRDVPQADHTFSEADSRQQLIELTRDWALNLGLR